MRDYSGGSAVEFRDISLGPDGKTARHAAGLRVCFTTRALLHGSHGAFSSAPLSIHVSSIPVAST